MSLYTTIYWTKRTVIVVCLVAFICFGVRIFQIVSSSLTVNVQQTTDYKAENGFGTLNKLSFTALKTPPSFAPTNFVNNTINGNFDADNNYPFEKAKTPYSYNSALANVYKIIDSDKAIDINTTEIPRQIAKTFGFQKEPVQTSSTVQTWSESNRKLEIDGQFLLVNYENNNLNTQRLKGEPVLVSANEQALKTYFLSILKNFNIQSDFESYRFTATYVNYDRQTGDFVPSGTLNSGDFIRISAERFYPNLFRQYKDASSNAAYPNYIYSNNNIVVSSELPSGKKPADTIARISLYNWPIDQNVDAKNKNLQTYRIKTPKQAFDELKSTNKYLISISEEKTHKPVSVDELANIDKILVFRIRLENYEDVVNTRYIQPIYVIQCLAEKGDKQIELVYYLPAVI